MDSGSGASIIARIRTTEQSACRNPNCQDSRTLTSPDPDFSKAARIPYPEFRLFFEFFYLPLQCYRYS